MIEIFIRSLMAPPFSQSVSQQHLWNASSESGALLGARRYLEMMCPSLHNRSKENKLKLASATREIYPAKISLIFS